MRRAAWFALLMATLQCQVVSAKDKRSFRSDLRPFGYSLTGMDYSTVGFLSDDLLLVAINQRFYRAVDTLGAEGPSALIVFDLTKTQPPRVVHIAILKAQRTVVPLTSGEFLILSSSDVKLCSPDLRCDKSFSTDGALPGLDQDSFRLFEGTNHFIIRTEDKSDNGERTVDNELESTTWNKIVHPLEFDEPKQPDLRKITVQDKRSGRPVLTLHYNPKHRFVGPALSPNGTKLAMAKNGILEVYDVP